jgi:hypothetical protein
MTPELTLRASRIGPALRTGDIVDRQTCRLSSTHFTKCEKGRKMLIQIDMSQEVRVKRRGIPGWGSNCRIPTGFLSGDSYPHSPRSRL